MLIALALGMDSFSMCLGLGTGGFRKRVIWLFTAIVGLFHVIFPLLGLFFGIMAGRWLGNAATILGALILMGIGLKMIYETYMGYGWQQGQVEIKGWEYVLLPLGVSIDSLTVGFGLGTFGFNFLGISLVFGLVAAVLTRLGFFLGDRVGFLIKSPGYLAGTVLLGLGIYALF